MAFELTFQRDGGDAVTVNYIPGTLRSTDSHNDVTADQHAPVLRYGIARDGECLVEVKDAGSNSKTLSELLALHSPLGIGDYTVTGDDIISSYEALVSVSIEGEEAMFAKIEWEGTIGVSPLWQD